MDSSADRAVMTLISDNIRSVAERIEGSNPDRCPDWSDGVEWAVAEMRRYADAIEQQDGGGGDA